jgi:succinate dehydrogenase / fumarate reductase flavoprotein subunit
VRPGTELARAAQRELRELLWTCCGVVRDEAGLHEGLRRLDDVRGALPDIDVRPTQEGWGDLAQVLDLEAGITLAEATMRLALARTETRGCHNRSDFPQLDPLLQVNLRTRAVAGTTAVGAVDAVPVPPTPPELVEWLERPWDVELAGRLLE